MKNIAYNLRSAIARLLLTTVTFTSLFFAMPVETSTAATQDSYRWRNDNGTEATATFAAAENATLAIPAETTKRLRFGVSNDGTESDLERIAASAFADGGSEFSAGVRDASGGYLYAVTNGAPASILKIDEDDFSVDGVIHMDSDENYGGVNSLAIDVAGGYLYWGTATSPAKIVKIQLSNFTRHSTLTLNSGENTTGSLLIDTVNDFLYLGTRTVPGKVVKVSTSTFTRDSAVTFSAGESIVFSGVIDVANGMSFWGTFTSPGIVVQVDLSPFSRVTGISGSSGENNFKTAVIDTTNNFAYFGTDTATGIVVKYNTSSFARVGGLTLTSGEGGLRSSAIDIGESKAFFGTDNDPGNVVQVNLSTFTRTGVANGNTGESYLGTLLIDDTNDLVWGFSSNDGDIVEFDYSSTLARSTAADVSSVSSIHAGVIDTAAGFAYFGTYESVGRIHKVNLSTLALVATIELPLSHGGYITSAVIDTSAGFAYFGNENYPGTIVKIRLSDFTLNDTLNLSEGNALYSASIDPAGGYAYFMAYDESPAKIMKIDLSPFSEADVLTLNAGEEYAYSSSIDLVNGDLFVGLDTDPGKVVKIDLGSFTRTSAVTFNAGESWIEMLAVDGSGGFGYAGTYNDVGKIVKFSLSAMTRTASVTSGTDNFYGQAAVDSAKQLAYFPAYSSPGKVVQLDLNSFGIENTLALNAGEVNSITFLVDSTKGKGYVGTQDSDAKVIELDITPNPRLRLEYGEKVTTCAAISSWFRVGVGPEWSMSASSNFTDGAATTNSASITDGNTTFVPGQALDTSSQSTYIALSFNDFTEVEYSVTPTASANDDDYCFRLTDAGTAADFTYTTYAEASLTTLEATLSNAITMGRVKAGASGDLNISFQLQNELTGTFTATLPVGFAVTGAFTGGTCSGGGTVDTFAFNGGSRTLTAEKHSCSGTLSLTGATITNPSSPGYYLITWTNDDPGEGGVAIVDDDQVTVTAQVGASITFDVDTAATDTESAAPYAVPLGTITVLDTRVSGATDSVNFVWLDLDTNATGGAVITVKNTNGANGLASTSVPGDDIDSASSAVSDGVENYGICAVAESDSGGNLDDLAPFDGSCTGNTEGNTVGGFDGTAQPIYDTDGDPIAVGRAQIAVQASIASTTAAHNDYTDTLTFIATGTF